jgi:hypothetical protein
MISLKKIKISIKNFFKNIFNYINNNKIQSIQITFIIFIHVGIGRVIQIHLKNKKSIPNNTFHNSKTLVYDKNGEFLTTIKNLPHLIIDISLYKHLDVETRKKIFTYFANFNHFLKKITFDQWDYKLMNAKIKFVEIKLKCKKNQLEDIENFIIPINNNSKILNIHKKMTKYLCYPNSLAYIIGLPVEDGFNFSSITKFLNQQSPEISKIQLTIDIRIQEALYHWAHNLWKLYNATSVWICVIDLEKRELVASVCLPSFDPNADKIFINFNNTDRIFNHKYEMGSICKILSYLYYLSDYSGLNYDMNTIIDVPAVFKIGRFEIKDVAKFAPKEPFYNCFVQSSNKAFASIMAKLNNPEKYRQYLNMLGLHDEITIDGVFKDKPMTINKLQGPQAITLAYGYGKMFTPLRFLYMISNAITGKKEPFHIIQNIKNNMGESIFQRVHWSKKTLDPKPLEELYKTLNILGQRFPPLYKFKAASKTGTAKALINGQYQSNRINCTLMTFYPAEKPRYLIFFCVEDPHSGPRKVSHFYTRMNMPNILDDIHKYLDENIK